MIKFGSFPWCSCAWTWNWIIVAELKLSPDVAGATFMAAGSSAPELATVVIGVFFAKDDIGVSGVIGSAVFNIMFVISVCALCAGTVCQLNWWPIIRDCFFYALSILVMLFTIYNEKIFWCVGHLILYLLLSNFLSISEKSSSGLWCHVVIPTFWRTFLPTTLLHPEDGGSEDLWNNGILPQHYTVLQSRRPWLESSPPWEPWIFHSKYIYKENCWYPSVTMAGDDIF